MKMKDITDQRFGKLIAKWPAGRNKSGAIYWLCVCDCGNTKPISTNALQSGGTVSCGCYRKTRGITHGQSCRGKETVAYKLWTLAKYRAKEFSIPFNITIEDIIVPLRCPLLNIPLKSNRGGKVLAAGSPTLDRVIPSIGYTKGNVWVISAKANRIKSDLTLSELENFVN